MKFLHYLAAACAAATTTIAHAQTVPTGITIAPPQLGKAPIHAVVKAMTLEEKVRLVVGTGMRFAGRGPIIGEADGRVPGAAGNTMNITRLGIPATVYADGPAGVRIDPIRGKDSSKTYYATAWPVGTLLASSWDTALVKSVGTAFGDEIRDYGVDFILGPGMNIQRNPLNGRNFEYYSEDPLVSGLMAASMVNGIQSQGVGTSIKHFAANNQESNRGSVNAIISERALREIYLRGFEIAIKLAQPWTVMSSYNKINGTYTSESADLLTTILRDEWGFKGFVMTDWFGGHNRAAQVHAGNDLLMPGGQNQLDAILTAIKNGSLDSADLDRNVEKILNVIVRTPSFHHYAFSNHPDLKAHAVIARKAAAEGMILLQNNHATLPLQKARTLALFGNASYATIMGGTGSGEVHSGYTISIEKGLENAGFKVVAQLAGQYRQYIQEDEAAHPKKAPLTLGKPRMAPEYVPADNAIETAINGADEVIYTLGRNAGEGADRSVTGDFNLSETEQTLISKIAKACHAQKKKLIIVLNIGGQVEIASWKDKADAILLAWQPGEQAGNAVADVLSGAVNPSGKLAVSFPIKYEDEPSAKDFPGTPADNPSESVYREGIYVGYRYFTTFHVRPAFPFGFGLCYTQFRYSPVQLSGSIFENQLTATVTVTNTGKVAGREIVQLYLHAPAGNLDKPAEELKGFAKTRLQRPGESQTVRFTLDASALASFHTNASAWIAEAGTYKVMVGASSEDIKSSAFFTLPKDRVTQKVHKALAPQTTIDELRP
ncbi:MAG TPA: glycoside hydrolase family 3 C-terminal domain-containing protein [Puia sp.]|nr:glycoside hydrolase family 3 C-terminal domain-containing protein [Puia sp.]